MVAAMVAEAEEAAKMVGHGLLPLLSGHLDCFEKT